jgi:hypothetical protein
MLELHAHVLATQRGEWELSQEELDSCAKRRQIGERESSWGELD